jgi:hypothetical protein
MSLSLVKTTLSFNPLFHHRLKGWAHSLNQSMASVIEAELMPILERKQREHHRRIFDGLYELAGIIHDPAMKDASTTIDTYLYGTPDKPEQGEQAEHHAQ